MSCKVIGTSISLTRGDTFKGTVNIMYADGTAYEPVEGDSVRFALKKTYNDNEPLLEKDIPINTLLLHIAPEDTKNLSYGKYVYDIQLTRSNGDVDTFITKATFRVTEEVD